MLLNDEGVSFHSTLILTSVEVYHVLSLLSHPQHQWVDLLVRVTLGKHFDIRARYTCWDEVTIAGTSAALVFIQLVLCLRFLFFILLLLGSAKWTWIYRCSAVYVAPSQRGSNVSRRSSGQKLRYCQPRDTIFKRCPGFAGASSPWRTFLKQLTYEVPGELLVSCLRSTGSTLSPSCIATLFILSLRLSPDIL